MSNLRFVGLDVHAETIAVCVAEAGGEDRPLGTIPNRLESIRKLVGKLGPVKQLRTCYEAGLDGLRAVLATRRAGCGVGCGCADAGPDQGRRSGKDGSAGCGETGALSS